MPTYPVKNLKTGEEKELSMTMKEYCEWKDENPDWDKDWSKGVGGTAEVGDWRNKLDGGWNEVLDRVGKQSPRSNIKKYNNY